ncbi:MAG: multidrug efflux SMR transporter [Synergistales bacterium]|nr:multidrug efflux SMR transporter [Synergistales bacterium]
MTYLYLLFAIIAEVFATSMLKLCNGFTRPGITAVSMMGYMTAFYFMSLSFRAIPFGIAYAIWSGVGIVFITFVGAFVFRQLPDLPALVGIGLIAAGIVVIHLFSKTVRL